jgi:hypothetical protein
MRRIFWVVCLSSLAAGGCAVHQAKKDQDRIRTALLDLYTNQVIDNLVRTYNRLPIIQIDYIDAQGMVTVEGSAGLEEEQTAQTTRSLLAPLSKTRQITTHLTGNWSLKNTNQITLKAEPVTASNEVYDAYLEFLSIPGSVVVTLDPPPECAAHVCKKYCGKYYWVPVDYADDFFRLSLLTTAQRGKRLLPPDASYKVKIVEVLPGSSANPQRPAPAQKEIDPNARIFVTIKLDRELPNDNGYIEIEDDLDEKTKKVRRRDINEYVPTTGTGANDFKPSNTRFLQLAMYQRNEQAFRDFMNQEREAKVYLEHRRPELPTTDDSLRRANFELHQINQNLVRQSQ